MKVLSRCSKLVDWSRCLLAANQSAYSVVLVGRLSVKFESATKGCYHDRGDYEDTSCLTYSNPMPRAEPTITQEGMSKEVVLGNRLGSMSWTSIIEMLDM